MGKGINVGNFPKLKGLVCNLTHKVNVFWSQYGAVFCLQAHTDNHHAAELLLGLGEACIRRVFLRKKLADGIVNRQILDKKPSTPVIARHKPIIRRGCLKNFLAKFINECLQKP